MNLQIISRAYLSISHIQSAVYMANNAFQIEREHGMVVAQHIRVAHQAYVTGAIFSSVAYLEANINELYSDAADSQSTLIKAIPTSLVKTLKMLWDRGIPRTARYSILDKYELALDLGSEERYDHGRSPYQDIKLLIELRNALIHYEPESVLVSATRERGSNEVHKFEKKLKGRFSENPITGPGNAFFPDKCLGFGCAKWGAEKAIEFVDLFSSKFGIASPIEHVRATLIISD